MAVSSQLDIKIRALIEGLDNLGKLIKSLGATEAAAKKTGKGSEEAAKGNKSLKNSVS